MRISQNKIILDLEDEIQRRFDSYNKLNPPKNTRRLPSDLIELLLYAAAEGVKKQTLSQISGVASSTINRWQKCKKTKKIPPRRLEIVREEDVEFENRPNLTLAEAIVRLPSGIAIELMNSRSLTRDFLITLSELGR